MSPSGSGRQVFHIHELLLSVGSTPLRLFEDIWRAKKGSPAVIRIFQQRILQGCADELPGVLARRRV